MDEIYKSEENQHVNHNQSVDIYQNQMEKPNLGQKSKPNMGQKSKPSFAKMAPKPNFAVKRNLN